MNNRNHFSRFFLGKGIYVALAVCLAGAGTAAWITINNRIAQPDPFTETPQVQQTEPQENIDPSLSAQESPENTEVTPVEQKQSDIVKPESVSTEEPSDSSSSGSSSEDTTASVTVSEPLEPSDKSQTLSFTLPLNTQVLSPFSGDRLVENKTLKEWRTHNGVDLKAEQGDMVKSACDGKVSAISYDPLWGTSVEISSKDYVMTYSGLGQDLAVKLNDPIAMGESIGVIGEIPCEAAEGLHLHFTIKKNNEYIDPLSLLAE